MFLSVFDLFKVGIGPSSSHTVGPMVAMNRFLDHLTASGIAGDVVRVVVTLYGSLAYTGKGHGTDRAVVLGLLGERPDRIDPADVKELVVRLDFNGWYSRAAAAHRAQLPTASEGAF